MTNSTEPTHEQDTGFHIASHDCKRRCKADTENPNVTLCGSPITHYWTLGSHAQICPVCQEQSHKLGLKKKDEDSDDDHEQS